MPIYKLKDKPGYRVQVNYTDSFGKKKTIVKQNKDTQTLKQAKQVEAELLLYIKNITFANQNMTLDEFREYYINTISQDIKKSSLSTKIRRYKTRIKPYFGTKKINTFTMIDFQNWKNDLLKKNLSIDYLNGIYAEFNSMLNFAVKYDFLATNYLNKLGCFKNPNAPLKEYNIWSVSDFEKFINVVRQKCLDYEKKNNGEDLTQWGYYVQYNIIFYCGCRKGEVYPLTWNDFDLNRRILKIRKNLIYKVEKGTYIITTPKTKKSIRDIPLPQKLINVLLEHKKRYENVYGFNDSFYICGGLSPLTDTKLAEFCKECAREAGVKELTIHEIRHTHASILIKNKVDILAISKRLGHSSIRETMETYVHLFEETEYEVADVIDNL